jgi:hypothetical protein
MLELIITVASIPADRRWKKTAETGIKRVRVQRLRIPGRASEAQFYRGCGTRQARQNRGRQEQTICFCSPRGNAKGSLKVDFIKDIDTSMLTCFKARIVKLSLFRAGKWRGFESVISPRKYAVEAGCSRRGGMLMRMSRYDMSRR